jgi:hypothetical protein
MLEAMKAVLVMVALAGCVTTLGIVKKDETPFTWLAAGTAGDLVGVAAIAGADGLTTGASIGTALAVTAVDVFVGCLLGACHSLKL